MTEYFPGIAHLHFIMVRDSYSWPYTPVPVTITNVSPANKMKNTYLWLEPATNTTISHKNRKPMPPEKPQYTRLIIFYFSGTGNARLAARKIAEVAGAGGVETVVYNIAVLKRDRPGIPQNALLGFCFPTHGFNAAPSLLNFVFRFPKGKNRVFLLNTRAGLKAGKLHIAGIGGLALWVPALMLLFKGYRIAGLRPLDLPSNWISLHPGLTKNAVDFIAARCERTLEKFTRRILTGKPVLNGLYWLPLDIAVSPIAPAYYFFGRYALAKTFFASSECNNCGLCIKNCPVQAIKTVDDRPYWTYDCESCMRCMNHCSRRAIETAHGFSFLIWWLAFSVVPAAILKALANHDFITSALLREYSGLLFNTTVFLTGLIVIFFGYRILHFFLRYRWINKIVTFSSFTRFKFWNRYRMKEG